MSDTPVIEDIHGELARALARFRRGEFTVGLATLTGVVLPVLQAMIAAGAEPAETLPGIVQQVGEIVAKATQRATRPHATAQLYDLTRALSVIVPASDSNRVVIVAKGGVLAAIIAGHDFDVTVLDGDIAGSDGSDLREIKTGAISETYRVSQPSVTVAPSLLNDLWFDAHHAAQQPV